MKKVLWTAAALALPLCARAQSSVEIYGIWDVSVEHLRLASTPTAKSSHITALTSDTSRIGFRGTEDLGSGLRAYFKLEHGFQADTGAPTSTTAFWSRESYVGLGSVTFGSIQLGSQFAPGNRISGKSDPFYRFGIGGQYTLLQGTRGYQNRYDNVVQYITPEFGGVTGRLVASAGEGAVTGASYSGSVEYAKGPIYAAALYDQVKATAASVGLRGGPVESRTVSIAGTYDFQVVKLHGWYQRNTINTLTNVTGYMAGATVPVGLGEVKASYSHRSATGADASLWAVGYIYSLSKRTALYTTIGHLTNSGSAVYRMGPATAEQAAAGLPVAGQDIGGAQFGIRHFF